LKIPVVLPWPGWWRGRAVRTGDGATCPAGTDRQISPSVPCEDGWAERPLTAVARWTFRAGFRNWVLCGAPVGAAMLIEIYHESGWEDNGRKAAFHACWKRRPPAGGRAVGLWLRTYPTSGKILFYTISILAVSAPREHGERSGGRHGYENIARPVRQYLLLISVMVIYGFWATRSMCFFPKGYGSIGARETICPTPWPCP
jgi:hypothetical protein